MLDVISRPLLITTTKINCRKVDRSVPLVSTRTYSAPIREYKNKTHDQDQTKTIAMDESLND